MKEKVSGLVILSILLLLGIFAIFVQLNTMNAYIKGMFLEIKNKNDWQDSFEKDGYDYYDPNYDSDTFDRDYLSKEENKMDISKLDDFDTNIKMSDDLVSFLNDFGSRNGIISIKIPAKTQNFLKEQSAYIPYNGSNNIPNAMMEEYLYYNELEMNTEKYQETFFRIRSAIALQVKVKELSSGEKITVVLAEESGSDIGELFFLIYQGENNNIYTGKYINAIGVPLDFTSYQTLHNKRALAVAVMVSDIGDGEFVEPK